MAAKYVGSTADSGTFCHVILPTNRYHTYMIDDRQHETKMFSFYSWLTKTASATTMPKCVVGRRPVPKARWETLETLQVREGVKVVVISFMEILHTHDDKVVISGNSLDFECVRQLIATLDSVGFSDTVHLVSFRGWDGPHLDTSLTAQKGYSIWKERVGDIFHGIDWDLEGHDDLGSLTNMFSVECLSRMSCISLWQKMTDT